MQKKLLLNRGPLCYLAARFQVQQKKIFFATVSILESRRVGTRF